jgi:peptidoglycan L-alanyl-D-glutamate endopeptidase CwlK
MASRRIEDLHPSLQPLARDFIAKAQAAGLDPLITCTYRSNAEQAELYAQGRTKPGKVVTNARPGQSLHNHTEGGKPAAKAFDIVPLVQGKPQWQATHPHWHQLGALGKSLGLEWAGDWRTFREYPHFQLPKAGQSG